MKAANQRACDVRVGVTKTGKDIYANALHVGHECFTPSDHKEASKIAAAVLVKLEWSENTMEVIALMNDARASVFHHTYQAKVKGRDLRLLQSRVKKELGEWLASI